MWFVARWSLVGKVFVLDDLTGEIEKNAALRIDTGIRDTSTQGLHEETSLLPIKSPLYNAHRN